MVLRISAILYSFAMAFVCIFQVEVVAQDNCDCQCLEKSLNGKSLCQHLSTVLEELDKRMHYISQLERMTARIESLEEKIRNQESKQPEALHYTPGPTILNDLNETWYGIKNLENKLQNVTSFVQKLDIEQVVNSELQKLKETVFKNDLNQLHNTVEGLVYRNDTEKLNERLDSVETKLSNLTNFVPVSRVSRNIKSFQKALKSINETVYQNIHSEESHQSLLEMYNNSLTDLQKHVEKMESLRNVILGTEYGLDMLQNKIQDVTNQTEHMRRELADLVIQSSLNERKRMMDQLENFKKEWILNCSKGITPCVSPESKHSPLASDPTLDKNYIQKLKRQFNWSLQGTFFWGCAPIAPENFPNLMVTRIESEKTLVFSCVENTILYGNTKFTQCHEGKWKPDTPPICVTRSTYPSIPECPEIKVGMESSLLMIVKDTKKILFLCSDGKMLRGNSYTQCIKGKWVPNSIPICEYRC